MTAVSEPTAIWVDVASVRDLEVGRGVCALVDGRPVAVFRVPGDAVYAISDVDPFSGASVLSRGITGSAGDIPKVASPVYKQCFDLRTGRCLDDPDVRVAVFPVRVRAGRIEVGAP